MFEPLIGKKSIQYANGPGGRKRRQLMDRSFSHETVKDYYEHFVAVNMNEKKAEEVKQLFSSGRVFLCDLICNKGGVYFKGKGGLYMYY